MTRHSRRNPLAWCVALLALVVVLKVVAVIEWLAGLSLLLAAAGLVVWAVARRGRCPVPPGHPPQVIPGRAGDAEVIRLRAEVAQLRAELGEARESARRAWQDASDPDADHPGAQNPPDMRSRLLADQLSGVQRLGIDSDRHPARSAPGRAGQRWALRHGFTYQP
jgi:hypothetical protein